MAHVHGPECNIPLSERMEGDATTHTPRERIGVRGPKTDLDNESFESVMDKIARRYDDISGGDLSILEIPPYVKARAPGGPKPDDQLGLFSAAVEAPPGKRASQLWRLWEGALKQRTKKREVFSIDAYAEAERAGLKINIGKDKQSDEVIDFIEKIYGDRRDPVSSFPEEQQKLVQMLYDNLDEGTAHVISVDPSFEVKKLQDYFPHSFKTTRGNLAGGGADRQVSVNMKLGSRPGWMKKRTLKGELGDMLEQNPDLDLHSWDPIDMVLRRGLSGDQYAENVIVMQRLKTMGLVMAESDARRIGGQYSTWVSPDAPGFRPKAVPSTRPKDLAGQTSFDIPLDPGTQAEIPGVAYTSPWVVPPEAAKVINDWYGISAFDTNMAGRLIKKGVLTAKTIKVMGGLFQQFDFTNRMLNGMGVGFQEYQAIPATGRAWRAAFDKGYANRLLKKNIDNPVRNVLDKFAIQAGSDPSFVEGALKSAVGEDILPIPILKNVLTFFGGEAYGRFHSEMLYSAGEILHRYFLNQGLSFDAAGERAAARVNEFFSSPARWQSVLNGPTSRDIARVLLFAPGEAEGWARITFRAATSKEGARFMGGMMLGTFMTAQMMNVAFTGHLMENYQLLPFTIGDDDRGGIPFVDFNTNMWRPELPYEGPLGRKIYLDLLGQADTPIRFALSPIFGIKTRLGQVPGFFNRVVAPTFTGQDITTFGNRPVDLGKPLDVVRLIGEQLAPIPATAFASDEVTRIGAIGGALQAIFGNVSGEGLLDLLERKWNEKPEHANEPFNPDIHFDAARQDPDLKPIIDEMALSGRNFGNETSIAAETRRGILTEEEKNIVPFSQGVLNSTTPDAGEKWREQRRTFLTISFATAAQAFANTSFDDPKTPEGKLMDEFREVDLDDYLNLDTLEHDFAAFDKARQDILDEIAISAPQAVSALETKMRFNDPDNIEVERMYQQARPIVDQLYDDDSLATFRGITQEQEQELREFMRSVTEFRSWWETNRGGEVPSVKSAIGAMGRQQGKSENFIKVAIGIRPGSATRAKLKNVEREIFLLRNMDALMPLYPGFYDNSRMRQMIFILNQNRGTPQPGGAPAAPVPVGAGVSQPQPRGGGGGSPQIGLP